MNDSKSQTSEMIALLQQLLAEFDALQLAMPAIKIAEAIDCLEQSQGSTD
ncbi:hypothetical protein [Sphingorhabdus sp. Alg231-15]